MGVVGRQTIGQDGDWDGSKTAPEPLAVLVPIPDKLKQKLPVVAAVSQMVELSRHEIAIGPWHKRPYSNLNSSVTAQNAGVKTAAKHPHRRYEPC